MTRPNDFARVSRRIVPGQMTWGGVSELRKLGPMCEKSITKMEHTDGYRPITNAYSPISIRLAVFDRNLMTQNSTLCERRGDNLTR